MENLYDQLILKVTEDNTISVSDVILTIQYSSLEYKQHDVFPKYSAISAKIIQYNHGL